MKVGNSKSPQLAKFHIFTKSKSTLEHSRIAKFLKIDKVMDNVSGYVETRLKLFKIEAKEELGQILTRLIHTSVFILLLLATLLFASLSLAFYLGESIGSLYLGFGIVALVYVIFTVIIYFFADKLGLQKMIDRYLDKTFKNDEDE